MRTGNCPNAQGTAATKRNCRPSSLDSTADVSQRHCLVFSNVVKYEGDTQSANPLRLGVFKLNPRLFIGRCSGEQFRLCEIAISQGCQIELAAARCHPRQHHEAALSSAGSRYAITALSAIEIRCRPVQRIVLKRARVRRWPLQDSMKRLATVDLGLGPDELLHRVCRQYPRPTG